MIGTLGNTPKVNERENECRNGDVKNSQDERAHCGVREKPQD
jgi:hypothetical protein